MSPSVQLRWVRGLGLEVFTRFADLIDLYFHDKAEPLPALGKDLSREHLRTAIKV